MVLQVHGGGAKGRDRSDDGAYAIVPTILVILYEQIRLDPESQVVQNQHSACSTARAIPQVGSGVGVEGNQAVAFKRQPTLVYNTETRAATYHDY